MVPESPVLALCDVCVVLSTLHVVEDKLCQAIRVVEVVLVPVEDFQSTTEITINYKSKLLYLVTV